MSNNIQFHSDTADELHAGEAVGFYESDKSILHVYSPATGHQRMVANDATQAEHMFQMFVAQISEKTHKESFDSD
ncbi:MAG: hypothetical protein CL398_10430 [Acidiferrobacteraceae bacterium]|nr:hypothetical protein [Acidiferrobacteraceae bacterium]|tara:strand:+ start:528 stop:752 length:225 start_codon:yes stop_codon:yes gene_type:complete